MVRRVVVRMVVGTCLIAIVVGASAAPASAVSEEKYLDEGMYIGGIDEAVAERNGFQVVTNADGSQMSVPVTEEAKRLYEERGIDPNDRRYYPTGTNAPFGYDERFGWCGSSYIQAIKHTGDYLVVDTGFNVILPTVSGQWLIWAQPLVAGARGKSWNVGQTPGQFNRSASGWSLGPGWAKVEAVSSVTLENGDQCFSMAPETTFD